PTTAITVCPSSLELWTWKPAASTRRMTSPISWAVADGFITTIIEGFRVRGGGRSTGGRASGAGRSPRPVPRSAVWERSEGSGGAPQDGQLGGEARGAEPDAPSDRAPVGCRRSEEHTS